MKQSTDIKIKSRWLEIMQPFSFEVKGEVLAAICSYMSDGEVPELSEAAAMAFAFIRYEIDEALSRKLAAAERRRDRAMEQSRESPEQQNDKQDIIPPEAETSSQLERHVAVSCPPQPPQLTAKRLPRKLKKCLRCRAPVERHD